MHSSTFVQQHWRSLVLIIGIILVGFVATAEWLQFWVLTAVPIGFLFGFFLFKGDLCGASAFSEVVMMKDTRKVWGLWVAIVVSMVGFAALDLLELVTLNPKPFLYLNYIIGGVIFGAGTVLAGGCVSGCLYKAGGGNLNSMAALVGMPIGIALIEYGPLQTIQGNLKQFVLPASSGGSITLSSMTGMPFWVWALIIAALTGLWAFRRNRGDSPEPESDQPGASRPQRFFLRPWKPWQAGLAIGLLAIPAYLSSASSGRNYPLGVTHGVLQAEQLLIDQDFNHILQKPVAAPQAAPATPPPPAKKIVWWLVLLVINMFIGAFVASRLSGQGRLLPKPPEQTVTAFFGGIMVGGGAAIATGCIVGNILSGWALMSVGVFVFGIVTVLANWITTYWYLMGNRGSH
jgi:uncharacterized protein